MATATTGAGRGSARQGRGGERRRGSEWWLSIRRASPRTNDPFSPGLCHQPGPKVSFQQPKGREAEAFGPGWWHQPGLMPTFSPGWRHEPGLKALLYKQTLRKFSLSCRSCRLDEADDIDAARLPRCQQATPTPPAAPTPPGCPDAARRPRRRRRPCPSSRSPLPAPSPFAAPLSNSSPLQAYWPNCDCYV